MVTHIVFYKLKDKSNESIQKAKEVLESMKGKIPMLRSIQVGVDVLHTPKSYDIALVTKFDTMKDLEDYQIDPYHCSVVKKHMYEVREDSAAVDYET